jgi:TolA-binding protein
VFRAEAAGTYALKFYKQDFIRDYILNDHVQVIVGEAPETSSAGWFNPPLDRGRVSAERWPNAFEEAEALERSRAGSSASGQSVSPADAAPPESTEPGPPAVQPPGVQPAEAGTATAPPSPAGSGDEGIVPVRPPSVAGTAGQEPLPPESAAGAGGQSFLPEESLPEDYLRRAQEEFNAGRVAGALAVLDQFRNRFPSGSDEAWWLYGQFYEANSPSRNIRTALEYYRRLVREYPQSRRYNDARRRIAYLERYYINIQ